MYKRTGLILKRHHFKSVIQTSRIINYLEAMENSQSSSNERDLNQYELFWQYNYAYYWNTMNYYQQQYVPLQHQTCLPNGKRRREDSQTSFSGNTEKKSRLDLVQQHKKSIFYNVEELAKSSRRKTSQ